MSESSVLPTRRKLVIVGDAGCGKTSLLFTIAYGTFPALPLPVMDWNYVDDVFVDNEPVEYALWDTFGQEEYDLFRPLSYPGSHVIIIAFEIPDHESLYHTYSKWIKEVRRCCGFKIPVILVGCKADLRPNWEHPDSPDKPCPWVTRGQGERMAHLIGAHAYMECSALEMTGVREMYETATRAGMQMIKGVKEKTRISKCCVIC